MRRDSFDSEIAPWLRLAQAPGIGALSAARLLAVLQTPQCVFGQSEAALAELLGSHRKAQALLAQPASLGRYLDQVFAWLNAPPATAGRNDAIVHAVLSLHDVRYPPALRETDDPPPVLYALGAEAWLHGPEPSHERPPAAPALLPWHQCSRAMLAIVGSRSPTPQGLRNAQDMAAQLQAMRICIVSGLARGIDAAAHRGALQTASPAGCAGATHPATVAVLGTGVDRIYPAAHAELAVQIARQGLILSEQPLGTAPLAANFPRRNRIITGISQGTLVVEAAEKSGSLISARLAAEQGREVMAIPGSIHAPQSRGCHALIKQGAKLVETVSDVLEELPLRRLPMANTPVVPSEAPSAANPPAAQASPSARPGESPLLQAMGFDPVSLDTLCARTGEDARVLQAQLLELEMLEMVARLPGGWFQRIGQA
ncbi:DNA-protecting protein DprA [Corticibacter populi]|uniref:DNA-protecting protein DprA n=1 Tax=Corticibacter populi TaxID=1550736 RepID=A0A3M6QZF4_9BURK|nr:DNA-processing protein DprA [Corticibacter populi]RMX08321.1 DNA-protecting protein DprA [Corticibacter populi]RZS35607.1 DNA protecting protein DprA [Corticibacter populi]